MQKRDVPFKIPDSIFPLICEIVANKNLVPKGYQLSREVTLHLERSARPGGVRTKAPLSLSPTLSQGNLHELLPSGVPRGLHEALVASLGLDDDEEEVQLSAKLVHDLGMESIDRMDVIFHLERTYDLEIPRDDIMADDIFGNLSYVDAHTEQVNTTGMLVLRKRMPFADLSQFADNPYGRRFSELVHTVGFLKDYLAFRGVAFTPPSA